MPAVNNIDKAPDSLKSKLHEAFYILVRGCLAASLLLGLTHSNIYIRVLSILGTGILVSYIYYRYEVFQQGVILSAVELYKRTEVLKEAFGFIIGPTINKTITKGIDKSNNINVFH